MLRLITLTVLIASALLLVSGCGPPRPSSAAADSSDAAPPWAPVPTFTPTPVQTPTAATPQVEPTMIPEPTATTVQPVVEDETLATTDTETAGSSTESAVATPSATLSSEPVLTVNAAVVNVRRGPGTAYELVGTAVQHAQFPVTGRNEQGDWWQVCCVDGQVGWLYGPLVDVHQSEKVALAPDLPSPPASVAPSQPASVEEPLAAGMPAQEEVPADEPLQEAAEVAPIEEPVPAVQSGTAGNFDPDAQYLIVHYRVLGFDDNNGGIFNHGSQQLIFITVLDQNGQGMDGAVVKDAVGDNLNVITGSKGPGKAEIKMDWEPYKLYVAADPTGPVTSQVSNQMNNPYPHIPDIIGRLGPPDNEYAICPTVDDRCSPPFYHAHWSYEITFQKAK